MYKSNKGFSRPGLRLSRTATGGARPYPLYWQGWGSFLRVMTVLGVVAVLVGPVRVSGASSAGAPAALRGRFNSRLKMPLLAGGPDGTVDPTFMSGAGPNGAVNAVAVQSDGKILIGGVFNTFNSSTANGIVRLNGDGSRDNSFNAGVLGMNAAVNAIAVQSDGKILIGGNFTSYDFLTANGIARLFNNGNPDSFFNFGSSGANGAVNAIAVQSDGKIVIGGGFHHLQWGPRQPLRAVV